MIASHVNPIARTSILNIAQHAGKIIPISPETRLLPIAHLCTIPVTILLHTTAKPCSTGHFDGPHP